jgi:predicted nucleotidyltransferase
LIQPDFVSNDQVLRTIVDRLVGEFRPQKIYLFGSRAIGTARLDSDYDLFLVMKHSDLRPIARMQKAREILWDLEASVDVFIYTQEEFDEWKDELNSIPHTATTEGIELTFG